MRKHEAVRSKGELRVGDGSEEGLLFYVLFCKGKCGLLEIDSLSHPSFGTSNFGIKVLEYPKSCCIGTF